MGLNFTLEKGDVGLQNGKIENIRLGNIMLFWYMNYEPREKLLCVVLGVTGRETVGGVCIGSFDFATLWAVGLEWGTTLNQRRINHWIIINPKYM